MGILSMLGMGVAAVDLKEGDPAPPFSAQDQSGRTLQLSDFKGRSHVVLYFYPKDDTPGCTKEACSLRDGYGAIQAAGAVVLGVSIDDVAKHRAFSEKFGLPFSLLADPDKVIIRAYGVANAWAGGLIAKRVTFVIDKEGVVRKVLMDVDPRKHDQQVLEVLRQLG